MTKKTNNTNVNIDDVAISRLNKCIKQSVSLFAPPKNITCSQWADENRILTGNAEPGPWRTSKTPYLKEPMDAFTDYRINTITVVACSQAGKSELELNCIGYTMDNDPCVILLLQPTLTQVKRFSKLRVNQLIRDTKCLKKRIGKSKSKKVNAGSGDTVYEKSFPGGMLIMVGTNSAGDLASTPVKILIGDELDRFAKSAGKEGNPWQLAITRQTTFKKDFKRLGVSSPTVKGASKIVSLYEEGSQAIWVHKCPVCGEWHEIVFKDIRFDYTKSESENKKEPTYKVNLIGWACPSCGCISTEKEMKRQPQKWLHRNPEALKDGHASYWLKGFANAFADWSAICLRYLNVKNNPQELQVFVNTVLGELWEDRGDLASEDDFLLRREEYDAELPEGVLCLTCGVDTQDDRLEYEIVGHGRYKETWGIKKSFILGKPDNPKIWEELDDVIDRVYKFKNGRGLKVSITMVDSGGHYTHEVYEECYKRRLKNVFAVKGKGGDYRYIGLPTKLKLQVDNKAVDSYLFVIGVDSGKAQIMSDLKVQEIGPHYSHFPLNPDRGYDEQYFNGLLSEAPFWSGSRWVWKKLPGHKRNEPLDIRNYANAGLEIKNPNFDKIEARLRNDEKTIQVEKSVHKKKRRFRNPEDEYYNY